MSHAPATPGVEKVVIIGSGPASWTAALYVARADLTPLVFEGELDGKMLPGGQLMTTTEVENFPGYPNGVTGSELVEDIKKQAEHFGTRVLGRTVTSLDTTVRPFVIKCKDDQWLAHSVILATGATAKYLGIPSEEVYMNRGVSACATCDGALPRFRKKALIVVGGGDTAMEEANFLSKFASMVHIVHRRDKFRASKIMADRALANPKITVHWNSTVAEILGDESGVKSVRLQDVVTGATTEIECAGYFAAIGHKPLSDLVAGVVDMDETGYIITKEKSSYTNVDGLFACGDVQDKIYRQAITAAGSGCTAAIDATRWLESHGIE